MACRFLPFVLIGTILFVPATLCETVWSDLLMDEGMALPPVSESTAFLREPLIVYPVNGSLVDLVHVFPGYRRWSLTEKFDEIENQVFNLVKTPRYHKQFFAELGTFLKPNATGTYSQLNVSIPVIEKRILKQLEDVLSELHLNHRIIRLMVEQSYIRSVAYRKNQTYPDFLPMYQEQRVEYLALMFNYLVMMLEEVHPEGRPLPVSWPHRKNLRVVFFTNEVHYQMERVRLASMVPTTTLAPTTPPPCTTVHRNYFHRFQQKGPRRNQNSDVPRIPRLRMRYG